MIEAHTTKTKKADERTCRDCCAVVDKVDHTERKMLCKILSIPKTLDFWSQKRIFDAPRVDPKTKDQVMKLTA